MFWSCHSLYYRRCHESEPHQIHNTVKDQGYVDSVYHIRYKTMPPRYVRGVAPELRFQALAWWYGQVNAYACRLLTFKGNRFPPLSGLAKEVSDRIVYHYKAGIWLGDFSRGLLWTGFGGALNQDHSPSWSWLYLRGRRTLFLKTSLLET
jgi:hypothetical protein